MWRPGRGPVLAGLVAGGLLTLLAAGRTWGHGFTTGVAARVELTATGRQAAPVVAGLALVVLAAVVPLLVSGRRVRGFALAVALAAGLGIAVVAARSAADPAAALAELARASTGTTGSGRRVLDARATAWPWVAVAAGAAVAVLAMAGLSAQARWAVGGRKYERVPGRPAPGEGSTTGELDTLDAWQAFSRGDDPT